jgi:hypothetical protein
VWKAGKNLTYPKDWRKKQNLTKLGWTDKKKFTHDNVSNTGCGGSFDTHL